MVNNMTSTFSKAASAYRNVGLESRVSSSSGHELVTLLFEGFLERLQLAKLAIEVGDVSAKVRHFGKAIEILSEGLRTHLDLKAGGELAQNLDALYHYCSMRLLEANIKNDVAMLLEVHGLIEPVAEAWKQNWVRNTTQNSIEPTVVTSRSGSMQQHFKAFSSLAAYGNPSFAGV